MTSIPLPDPAPSPFDVVAIGNEHAQGFHACLDVVAREKRYLAQVQAMPLERIEAFVREGVVNDAVQFVALDGQRVVGWADIFAAWQPTVSHVGSLGMGVHPDYRGRGIGRRLLARCIDKAWSKGMTRIDLEVRADNVAAIALYERMGFTHEARRARGMRFDGVYFDSLAMTLLKPE